MDRTIGQAVRLSRPLSVSPGDSVLSAAKAMSAARCGSCVVVGDDGLVSGILTERDILNKIVATSKSPSNTTCGAIMTPAPYCAKPSMTVTNAIFLMREHGFRHVPVVDDDGSPIGMFSIRDAMPSEIGMADRITEDCERICEILR